MLLFFSIRYIQVISISTQSIHVTCKDLSHFLLMKTCLGWLLPEYSYTSLPSRLLFLKLWGSAKTLPLWRLTISHLVYPAGLFPILLLPSLALHWVSQHGHIHTGTNYSWWYVHGSYFYCDGQKKGSVWFHFQVYYSKVKTRELLVNRVPNFVIPLCNF